MIHRTSSLWQGHQSKNKQDSHKSKGRAPVEKAILPSSSTEIGATPSQTPEQHQIHTHHDYTWQEELQRAISCPQELARALSLPESTITDAIGAIKDFPLLVPRPFLARMRTGDCNDPLLLQILPKGDELQPQIGYSSDPLEEKDYNTTPGLIHKYQGRVLLTITGHCAINCRYCFRRHFPYNSNRLNRSDWEKVIHALQNDTSISEVIYSGGDPLIANDKQLSWLTEQIAAITHIKRLRVHTRLPVVIPERIDEHCLQWLTQSPLQTVMVLHINHANEVDTALTNAVSRLKHAGITVLNQSVFLRGINDSVAALSTLSEALFSAGVLPYYLHLMDKVTGAEHFDSTQAHAVAVYRELLSQLPGYLVPKLVREIPARTSKTPIDISIG